tara:strand:+ start:6487 stop:8619 length:2133 start_codon:yes stop_codon:yes gene_type:complete
MEYKDILTDLNEAQNAAVTTDAPHALILAGAGSGKTKVLVHRVAWYLQTGQSLDHGILAVTFTNKAAGEMKGRIQNLMGRSVQNMWIGTFHGIAHRFLKLHWKEAGLKESFQIIDSDDQLRVIRRIVRDLELDESGWSAKEIQYKINSWKERGLRSKKVPKANDRIEDVLKTVYHDYELVCERSSSVDFAELLLRVYELWSTQPRIKEDYLQRFRHILVDEFQDTNRLQYEWLKLLVGEKGNLFVVGDDDQSIYSWRGAKVENMQLFQRNFPDHEIVRLEQNYRSTSNILEAANSLITNNSKRIGKRLWTDGIEGEKIKLYSAYNERDEARYVVESIKNSFERGMNLSSHAVLYRVSAQSRVLEDALRENDVSYRVFGGFRFYERAEVKDVMAYLRLLFSREDDPAFERVINFPPRGIGLKTMEKVRRLAKNEQLSLWLAFSQLSELGQVSSKARAAFEQFSTQITSFKEICSFEDLGDIIIKIVDIFDLENHYKKDKQGRGLDKIENLQELVAAARDFSPIEGEEPLSAFLAHAALESGEDQADSESDYVQLMTLHSAKGLEFKQVFLVGLEEGLFPHQRSLSDLGQLEEERRLCYVGITRAEETLTMTYALSRQLHGSEHRAGLSRFVREIPADLIDEIRVGGSYLSAKSNIAVEKGFAIGQSVFHKVFGNGVILGIEGMGGNSRVQVNFEDSGTKWLVTSYAGLETR